MHGGLHVKFNKSSEDFLAELASAAYDVAIHFQKKGSFVELEIGLWDALRKVIQQNMCYSPQCGSSSPGICTLAKQIEPWSPEACKYEMPMEEYSGVALSDKDKASFLRIL